MASEIAVNGNYAPHQGYGSLDHAGYAPATSNSHSAYTNAAPSGPAPTTQSNSSSAADIPKDEVGWYFVEQYYTTLSRSPEKLYLFYNKRSQFVSGSEAAKVDVSVGQKAILDRIKELDFQDCKVRVTNVDSQASDQNIVIQVIGEISNKSAPHKKFTQTFVLAGQTNGYFVLNDIFRYIVEEEDEVNAEEVPQESAATLAPSGVQEPAPTAVPEAAEPETLTSSNDAAAVEHDAAKVDKELQEKIAESEQVAEDKVAEDQAPVNGTANGTEPAASEPAKSAATDAPAAVQEASEPEKIVAEKPRDPEPTPAVSPPKPAAQPVAEPAQASPAAPSKPAAPKTWANLAAAAHRVVTPAVPAPQPSASAAPSSQPKAAAAPAPAAAAPASSAVASGDAPRDPSPAASQQDEWTSVGGDHKRQQSKAQAAAGAQEAPQYRAYIKNVNDTLDAKDLRAELEKYGELAYFDIARQKNCAFVDFKTAEAYKAAIDANPHQIGNERVVVEERRMKPGSYPYVQRGGMRGGSRGGASNQGNGRGSFQGGRGGFSQRGRGGSANASRGRGGAQAA